MALIFAGGGPRSAPLTVRLAELAGTRGQRVAAADLRRVRLDRHTADRVPVAAALLRRRGLLAGASRGEFDLRVGGPAVTAGGDAVIYQVYPRSFADADGDGIGDLPGITARLDHLAELGVDAVWLSPFYPSPQADAGYDVADYRDVDPLFGTLADFDALIAAAQARGLRVIVDLVPNHTSVGARWFQAALAAGPGSAGAERYIFREGRGAGRRPAAERLAERLRRPGLDPGHRADGRPAVVPAPVRHRPARPQLGQPRGPRRVPRRPAVLAGPGRRRLPGRRGARPGQAGGCPTGTEPQEPLVRRRASRARRPPMWDQDGVHEIYREWRRVLDGYPGDRILVAEAWVQPAERLARYVRPDEMHQAFNFEYLWPPWDAPAQCAVITPSLAATDGGRRARPPGCCPTTTWSGTPPGSGCRPAPPRPNGIGAGDPQPDAAARPAPGPRGHPADARAARLGVPLPGRGAGPARAHRRCPTRPAPGPDLVRAPGTPSAGRDGCRVPIPWEADAPAYGFGPDRRELAAAAGSLGRVRAATAQRGVAGSTYELYRQALRLRREHGLGARHARVAASPDDVLAFRNGVIQLARDEARKATTSPSSSARPKRPNGSSRFTYSAMPAGFSCCRFHHDPPSNRNDPGDTLLTRMLDGASCCASDFARLISAALTAL